MQSVQEKDGSGLVQDAFYVKIKFVFCVCVRVTCCVKSCVPGAVSMNVLQLLEPDTAKSSLRLRLP